MPIFLIASEKSAAVKVAGSVIENLTAEDTEFSNKQGSRLELCDFRIATSIIGLTLRFRALRVSSHTGMRLKRAIMTFSLCPLWLVELVLVPSAG